MSLPPIMNMTSAAAAAAAAHPADPPYSSVMSTDAAGFRRTTNSRKRHIMIALNRRDGPDPSFAAAQQQSLTKGYTDGFFTAKIFAAYGLSKLGFTGQYIADSIAALGPTVVAPGTEDMYNAGFMKGLADGENAVATSLNGQQGSGQ